MNNYVQSIQTKSSYRDGFQVLLVTGGEGWYQEEGKTAQLLKAGDVIVTHGWHTTFACSYKRQLVLNILQ